MKRSPIDWSPADLPDLSGQVFLVTGANSGIGLEAAKHFAGRGAHTVLACRNPEKGQAALEEIRAGYPDSELELMALDLADLGSVRAFADDFSKRFQRLDVLLNNAGLMAPPLQHTKDGFEMQFGTNHLGHFALTGLLLDKLEEAQAPRIVSVSSLAHTMGDIYFDNLNAGKWYKRWKFYGQSKLANLMFALELDKRLQAKGSGIRSMAVHPGYTATHLQRSMPGGKLFNALMAQPQHKGCYPSVFAATSEQAQSGEYYGPHGFMEMRGMPAPARVRGLARKQAVRDRLWQVSEELTGVRYLND